MPAAITGKTQPWFTINEFLSRDITGGEVVDTSGISAVSFDKDVNISIGSLQTPFALPSGTALGIDSSTHSFTIDTAAFMFAMGGK